jgi:hypothetical protein
MACGESQNETHDSFITLGRARHGIEFGKTVPEGFGFEGADIGGRHKGGQWEMESGCGG